MEARHPRDDRAQPGSRPGLVRRAAEGRAARPRVWARQDRRHLAERQGIPPRRAQQARRGRHADHNAAQDRRRPHRPVRPRLGAVPEEGPRDARRGPVVGPCRAHRRGAAQPGASLFRARQRAGQERLVQPRCAGDAQDGGWCARSQARHLFPRGRCHAQPWRPAGRRPDASRHPQRPSAVRHHVVRHRPGADRRLSVVSLGERSAQHQRPHQEAAMIANDPYAELEKRFARMSAVNRAGAMLNWDRSTMMPEGASEDRADQLATLNVIAHELLVAPDMPELFGRAEENSKSLDSWRSANLREMRHAWIHASALPADLVEARTRATSACEMAWREAKKNKDFKALLPTFSDVLAITRRVGEAKAAALGLPLYDALLDEYEPGGRSARIDVLFAELKSFLPAMLGGVMERQASRPAALPLDGPFPIEAQRTLGLEMARTLGFDFRHGRLDVSAHPFTGGTPDDVRITTRYDEADFARALMGVLHETGHGLYEAGLPREWRRQPVGNARGMVLHESQSLLMEMQACRSE